MIRFIYLSNFLFFCISFRFWHPWLRQLMYSSLTEWPTLEFWCQQSRFSLREWSRWRMRPTDITVSPWSMSSSKGWSGGLDTFFKTQGCSKPLQLIPNSDWPTDWCCVRPKSRSKLASNSISGWSHAGWGPKWWQKWSHWILPILENKNRSKWTGQLLAINRNQPCQCIQKPANNEEDLREVQHRSPC